MNISSLIQKLVAKHNLSTDETERLFDQIFAGEIGTDDLRTILLSLHEKGETLDEIEGAVRSMRGSMLAIHAPKGAIDIVGTGGDGRNTFNISTAAAFVVAGAGVCVAKHGNRAATSLSGASDVLSMLGVNLEASFDILEKALHEIGIAFLFAPRHHPAMKFVAPVRKALGVRTIFNILGPMTNPANVKRHLIGVFDPHWAKPIAETLRALGSENAWVAYGDGGIDEISSTGPTEIVEMKNASLRTFSIEPETFSLPRTTLEDIRGGAPDGNAKALLHLLDGEDGPYRTIVLLNAASALIVAGKTSSHEQATAMAAASIDTGAAKEKLQQLIRLTNGDKA